MENHHPSSPYGTDFNSNSTNVTTPPNSNDITQNVGFQIIFGIILVVLFTLSTSSGLFVCGVIKKWKLTTKTIWIYIFCLALCDTASAFTSIPVALAATIHPMLLETHFFCNLSGVFSIFFNNWMIMTIVIITIHNFIAERNPIESLTRKVYRDFLAYLLPSLTLSVILALSPVVGFGRYFQFGGRPWCELHSHDHILRKRIGIVNIVFNIALPLLVLIGTVSSVCITKYRKKNVRLALQNITQMSERISKDDKNVIISTRLVIIVSFIFYAPSFYYSLGTFMHYNNPTWFGYLVYILKFSHGIVNAIIYTTRHQLFKEEAKIVYTRMSRTTKECRYLSVESVGVACAET